MKIIFAVVLFLAFAELLRKINHRQKRSAASLEDRKRQILQESQRASGERKIAS